jgi:hypothetical protein
MCSSLTTNPPAKSLDKGSLVLRLPHQRPPHPEEEAPALRGSGRLSSPAITPPTATPGKESWHAATNPEGRWRKFTYAEIISPRQDRAWTSSGSKDRSLADLDNLPEPDDLAAEIVENLEAGLNSFRAVLAALGA